jgi:hypothetical protein
MATPVYSSVLLEAHNSGSTTAICPAGYRWVLKSAQLYNGGTLPCTIQLFKTTSGAVFYSVLFNGITPAWNHWDGVVVVDEGDGVQFTCSALQQGDVVVSGFQLTLP